MQPRRVIINNRFRCVCYHALFTLAVFLFTHTASAQFNQYRNYNVSDGLPSSDVYDIMQDASGYLWFTTDMGASRFDGYEFRNFSNENGLPDNTIFRVIEDKKGRVWFLSFSGKLSYYYKDHIYTLPCNARLEELIKGCMMTSLYIDAGDTVWAGTTKNFAIKIVPGWKNEQVSRIDFPANEAYICLLGQSDFIFGNGADPENYLTFYQRPGKKLKTLSVLPEKTNVRGVRYAVRRAADGNFIVTLNNKIICCNPEGILSEKKLGAIGICIWEEKDGNILAGTHVGVTGWADKSFTGEYRLAPFDQKIITAIYRDREDNFWICSEGNGVYCMTHPDFSYFTSSHGLSESRISCAITSGRKVILGHLDGTLSILENASIRSLQLRNNTYFEGITNQVTTILPLNEKDLLVSTSNSFYSVNTQGLTNKLLEKYSCKKIVRGAGGFYWMLRYTKIYKCNLAYKDMAEGIKLSHFTDNIFEDRNGILWICSINGLWCYDKISGLRYLGADNPLLASRIVSVQQDPEGNMWFVSRGNGVIVKRGNTFFQVTKKDGLAGNMCRSILLDSGNVAWIGTNNGLSKISYSFKNGFNYSVKTFCSKHGLLTNEINHILRVGEKLWVVHTTGISVFDPASLEKTTNPPPVYIVNTVVNGDTIRAGENRFAYDQNYFNISFIGLSFKNPGQNSYRYKMEGVDSSWINTTYTSVKYQTLPPGHYRFLVAAKNNEGSWSKIPASISFEILPAWWQSWIFKLAVCVTGLLLILFIFKLRINIIQKREQQKTLLQNRIATFELNALRAQMNPHFVFNAINSVQYFITNNDPDSSQLYLSKFAKLIRYVVDNSKLTSIPIKNEIEALTYYLDLEALRFGTRFRYNIHIHPNVDMEYTQVPSMLIQPYVENAIWHGIMHKKGNGTIDVTLEMTGNILHCTVQDDGIGRQKSLELKKEKTPEARKSVGMSNTRDRLEIINQVNHSNMHVKIADLWTANGEACGTKVEIYIPINYIS